MQPNDYKEVDFERFCPTCQYKNDENDEKICSFCMDEPVNLHSKKPVKWVEKG